MLIKIWKPGYSNQIIWLFFISMCLAFHRSCNTVLALHHIPIYVGITQYPSWPAVYVVRKLIKSPVTWFCVRQLFQTTIKGIIKDLHHWPFVKAIQKFPCHGVTSNGSWCMGIKGEMSGTVCVTFSWDMYIYIWVVYSLCFFCCLFITVTWWYVWCFEWASGNQEEVQACLVTLLLFIISCYSLYKTTLGLLCSWFENNPHLHKYSMDFHV